MWKRTPSRWGYPRMCQGPAVESTHLGVESTHPVATAPVQRFPRERVLDQQAPSSSSADSRSHPRGTGQQLEPGSNAMHATGIFMLLHKCCIPACQKLPQSLEEQEKGRSKLQNCLMGPQAHATALAAAQLRGQSSVAQTPGEEERLVRF